MTVLPVVPVAGVVEAAALPNVVVLPNGRIVDEFCRPLPKLSGCAIADVAVVLPVGLPNVNVEFNEVGAVAVAAGVVDPPNKNPVEAGVAVVFVDVAPNTVRNKDIINSI